MRRVFRFNLLQAIKKLVSICESHEIPKLRHLAQKDAKDFKKEDKSEVLRLLLEYIVVPELTIKIGRIFRKIIPIILTELPNYYLYQSHNASTLEKLPIISSAISKLLVLCPHCLNIVLEFYQNSTSLLDCLESSSNKLEIIKTCYRFLKVSSAEFSLLWNWSKLFELLENNSNSEIQYFALKCISLYIGMSDIAKQELISQKFNVNPITASIHEYEDEAIEQAALFLGNNDEEFSDNDDICYTNKDLPASLVDVCGILFKRKQTTTDYYNLRSTELTYTETTEQNMLALALAVSQGHPILLEGITGAGKTALIDHLASETGNTDLIKVHLGDQADAKVLLGTYICTDVPGEFKWQAGALTQAVKEGRWIVIEDIDLAPMDVLSILIPLLETRQLFIPGRGEQIPAKNGFQMFATQTIGHLKTSATLLSNLWTRVFIEPLSLEELSVLLQRKYPELSSVVHKFLQTYKLLIRNKKTEEEPTSELEGIIATNRYISLRDLMKWCNRVDRLYKLSTSSNASIKEYIFCEAVDCFSGMISKVHLRNKFIQLIGLSWDLSPDRLHFYLSLNKPTINVAPTTASVGRVTLVRDSKIVHSPKSNFAYTMLSMQLLEKISVCVQLSEPVLLVGETGTGKTTVVQYLADLLGQKLVVMNLSQQSESSDLVGGFRPVEMVSLCIPLKEKFDQLFAKTFSKKKNADFCNQLDQTFVSKDWPNFLVALRTIFKRVEKMMKLPSKESDSKERTLSPELREKWKQFAALLYKFESQLDKSKNNFAFSFVEGPLIKAVREGHWVLLDEMNLASAETLESLSGLLEGGSLSISERGDIEPIPRHPNFRVFACMNPPNDVGKKDLAPGLRNRFTEFFVDELDSKEDLKTVVLSYLKDIGSYSGVADDIVAFYLEARELAHNKLTDGANHKPHYSLRTLCRSLEYVRLVVNDYGFPRGLFEGFSMSFLTQLNLQSTGMMEALLKKHLMKKINEKALLQAPPKPPAQNYEKFENFWIELGNQEVSPMEQYILTDSIKKNLNTLARIVIAKKYPILLQGPTSSGKTSMVEYLAKKTGHRFVRINNHEHTDLQEYLGTYISDSQGKLVFQEGILVEAVRKGYWIVLDELNLAPSEVLEALNRLLDDNRELFIPETGEVIKANAQFQLFATQNPPGLYGGRKVLSRAFRNRFIEIHVDDIPETELEVILEQRSKIPRSFAQKLVAIMKDLQRNRQSTQVFAGKHGFITLRDLFRWAERKPGSYDELAVTGYMLLAERLRKEEEKLIIKQAIEKNLKVTLDINAVYNQCEKSPEYASLLQNITPDFKIVWTNSMKRLFTLVGECMKYDEPILLVGETGNGKTTVCQLYSILLAQKLHILNCHQHTETSDFLGGLRPVRSKHKIKSELVDRVNACSKWVKSIQVHNDQDIEEIMKIVQDMPSQVNHKIKRDPAFVSEMKELQELYRHIKSLFIWYDGPLVQAMKNGDLFLIDEISLADDAVLERLNSVLEPHRLLVLAEKGSTEIEELTANKKFRILATMNPGGDFGKKELSPAMRNRFTEIWVPSTTNETDELAQIIESRFKSKELEGFSKYIIEFFLWFSEKQKSKQVLSVRDVLAWCDFMNVAVHQLKLSNFESLIHGAHLILLDGLGIGSSTTSAATIKSLRSEAFLKLLELIPEKFRREIMEKEDMQSTQFIDEQNHFGTSLFKVSKGEHKVPFPYSLQAPTTSINALRVLRALQLRKPVLLEGSPGVGKTSLISALASATGHKLVRINLSEHTDLMDLLGTDLPVEGGKPGEFQWCDGVFLRALKAGDWVLLDELNLAPQSVLEGLNSCLDHRTTIYIPELNHTFECPKEFRIFACQNPLHQGGGRKGLPKSFLNRFTKVFLDSLDSSDLLFIATSMYPRISPEILENMIRFNTQVFEDTMVQCKYGRKGSPWEFNLRDIFRWCDLIAAHPGSQPSDFVDLVYLQRMRTLPDRKALLETYQRIMGHMPRIDTKPYYHITPTTVQVGNSTLSRSQTGYIGTPRKIELLQQFLNPIENIMKCIEMNWMCILTGSTASGKTSMVRLLSQITRNTLYEFAMNTSVDTTELLGGFEQVDFTRYRKQMVAAIDQLLEKFTESALVQKNAMQIVTEIHNLWSMFKIRSRFPKMDPTSHLLFDKEEYQLVEKILQLLSSGTHEYASSSKSLLAKLEKFESLSQQSIIGSFEWVDGMLIQALEQGHWILIDNVNFCNPTVLDRLNPLLEPNGVLMVNERGLINGEIKLIKPHANFRIFLTMDTKHGEISRAMRNRGIEISLVDFDVNSTDTVTLCASLGIPVPLAKKMVEYHKMVVDSFGSTIDNPITLRNILDWYRISLSMCADSNRAKLLTEQVLRGISLSTAILHGAEQTYIKNRSKVQDYQTLRDLYASVFTSFDMYTLHSHYSLISQRSHDTLLSPNYWPVAVSASGYVTDSVETTIMRQGSLFQHFVRKSMLHEMERAVVTTNDIKTYVNKLPKSAHLSLPSTLLQHLLLDATKPFNLKIDLKKDMITEKHILVAGKYLIENLSLQDHSIRTQFFDFQLENYPNLKPMFSYVVRHLLAHPIMKEVEQIFSAVQNQSLLGYQSFNLNAPFLHRLFASHENLVSLKPRYLSLVQKLEFLIQRLFQEFSELQTYNSPKKTDMSLMHESYLHYNNKLGKTKPSNSFLVPLVYPLFKSIDDLLNALLLSPNTYIPFQELEEFVQLRDSYWKLLNHSPYQLSEVVVYWHFVFKYIQKHFISKVPKEMMVALENILGKFVEWAETHGYLLRMSPLWKHGHPSNLYDNQLFMLDCKFKEISRNIQVNSLLQTEGKNQWSEYVDEEFKRTLIDGLCTIRYLVTVTHKTEQFQRLFDHIKEIPTLLELRRVQLEADFAKRKTNVFASLPTVIDKDHTDDSTLRLVYLKHNPQSIQMLQDHNSLLRESEILGSLSKLSVPPYTVSGKFTVAGLEAVRELAVSIRQFINMCLQDTGRSVLHLVPYQTLLWYLTSYTPDGVVAQDELRSVTLNNLLQEMYYNFNSQIWNSLSNETCALNFKLKDKLIAKSEIESHGDSGSLRLYEDIPSVFTFLVCDWDQLSISYYPSKLDQLASLSKFLFSTPYATPQSAEWISALNIIYQSIACYSSTFESQIYEKIQETMRNLVSMKYSESLFSTLRELIVRSTDRKFVESSTIFLFPIFHSLQHSITTGTDLSTLGKLWANLGMFRLSLLLPSSSIDPSLKYSMKLHWIQSILQQIVSEVEIRQQIELLFTGKTENEFLEKLNKQISQLTKKQHETEIKVPVRPSVSQYGEIYAESHRFSTSFAEKIRVFQLIKELFDLPLVPTSSQDLEMISSQEKLWQDKAGHFVSTLIRKYPMYEDVIVPMSVAIYQIKHGLRLLANETMYKNKNYVNVLKRLPQECAVTSKNWDVIASAEFFLGEEISTMLKEISPDTYTFYTWYSTVLKIALFKIYIHIFNSHHISQKSLQILNRVFARYESIMNEVETERSRKEADENAFYKYKTRSHTELTQEQLDEKAFRQMFPDFMKKFKEFDDTPNMPNSQNIVQVEEAEEEEEEEVNFKEYSFSQLEMYQLYKIHGSIFGHLSMKFSTNVAEISEKDRRERLELSYKLYRHIVSTSMPWTLVNTEMRSSHFLTISQLVKETQSRDNFQLEPISKPNIHNIYKDSMIEEVKHIWKPMEEFTLKILEYLQEWPENPLLIALLKIVNRIVTFPITTPLIQIVTGLEILLKKGYEWEGYASKRVSIQGFLEVFSGIILRWRRLESESWPQLLLSVDKQFEYSATTWWFHMYRILYKNAESITKDDLKEIFKSLEQFMQTSNYGEFMFRLNMLHSFYLQLNLASYNTENAKTLKNMLANYYSYYSQFVPSFQERLEAAKKPVLEKFKDFIKLTRWETSRINYHRVREMAEKAHKNLNKITKEYKTVLEESMMSIFARPEEEIESCKVNIATDNVLSDYVFKINDFVLKKKGPIVPEVPSKFKSFMLLEDSNLAHNRLASIHKVMTKLCKKDILSTSTLRQDIQSIDEFSVHIIERAQDLKINEKEKSVKKFAFTELIKTLSSMGISSRIAAITQEQKEIIHLFSLSNVTMQQVHPLTLVLFSKTENYYFKLIGKILHMRNAAQNFSKDLSKREVDKTTGYAEQLLLMITKQRDIVSQVMKQLSMWKHYGKIIEEVNGHVIVGQQEKAKKWYLSVKDKLDVFSEILHEFLLVSEAFPNQVKIQVERITKDAISSLSQIRNEMSAWLSQFSNLDLVLWTSKQVNEISSIFEKFQEISLPFISISSLIEDPSLINGIYSFIDSMKSLHKSFQFEIQHESQTLKIKDSELSGQFISLFNSIITEIQLVIQSAVKLPKPQKAEKEQKTENDEEEEEEEETNILAMNQYFSSLLELLNPLALNDMISQLLSWIHTSMSSRSEILPLLFQYFSQLLPFIHQYELLIQGILLEFSQFHKSLCKLSFILFNIFTNLYLQGFCTPLEEQEADPNEKLKDNVSGTGIGEGEGNKDVSDQIEDEEDALGLKDDKPPPPPSDKEKKKDEGKEMENDFEGTMHDMPEEEEKDKDEDEEEEEKEEEEIEKEMGETNPDKENVLDEDVWKSDDEEEKEEEEEEEEESKLEKDAPMESDKPSEELAAKQNEKEQKQKDKNDKKEQNKDKNAEEENVEDIPDDAEENNEDQENNDNMENMEENHHIEMNEQEELKIDEDTKIDEEMDENEAEDEKGENPEDMETETNEEEIKDEKEEKKNEEEDPQQDENVTEETLNNQIQEETEKNEEEAEAEDPTKEPVHANENQDENQVEQEAREQPYGVQDNVGMPSSIQMQEEKDKQEKDNQNQTMPKQDQQMNAAGVTQDEQKYEDAVNKAEQDMPQQKERIDPNPYRNYGDALKQWKKRLQVVDIQVEDNAAENKQEEQIEQDNESKEEDKSLYRYLEQETNKEEKQALGPTKDEQNVQPKSEEEEEEKQNEQDKTQESKEEKEPEEKKKELEKNSMSSLDQKPMKAKAKNEEDVEMEDVQEIKDDVTPMDEEESGLKMNTISTTEKAEEDEDSQPKSAQDILEMRTKVETLINQWRDRGQKQNGEELWKKYEYLTNDLAQELCEQLRLILEPTLATKLKGDYKTGKRINMKKVIPYIASDFKKDKIWLRRTQPSKRDYQIMLAIDDSESMRDNHAGQIACEALAMIAKAMQQLEVGQLSIVSFGETIKLLHPFDVPFSPQSGADVIVDFTFKQKVTNVEALLDNLVKILDVAKTNASQADCMQIVFLISDGRFSEREGTKKWLREAHEKNIFVVFIVVDNPKSRDSILELKDVSYPNGKLLITRYIDKFPFNYYVILRDINKLPDVLADALRQWFELVKSM